MHILRQKLFLSLIVFTLFFCCQSKTDGQIQIKAILKGVLINNAQHYSYDHKLETLYCLETDTLSLRSKAEYDESNELSKLILYKSEGPLNYTRKDILDDTKLLDYSGYSLHQKIWHFNDTLLVTNTDTLKIKLAKNNKGEKVFIHQQNRNAIIFECIDR